MVETSAPKTKNESNPSKTESETSPPKTNNKSSSAKTNDESRPLKSNDEGPLSSNHSVKTSNEQRDAPPVKTPKLILPVNSCALSVEEVRNIFLQNAVARSCSVRDFVILENTTTYVYKYLLETFCEERKTVLTYIPYKKGEYIDGPENGPMPDKWEIFFPPLNLHVNQKVECDVPHSAYVRPCYVCAGGCQIACRACGKSRQTTDVSSRSKRRKKGTGFFFKCCGIRCGTCYECHNSGKLKFYDRLTVTWKNHGEQYISDSPILPEQLYRDVSGYIILENITETGKEAEPIYTSDDILNKKSTELILKHKEEFQKQNGKLIISQRQTLEEIPVTKIKYKWRNKTGEFYVCGLEKKVYFKNHLQKRRGKDCLLSACDVVSFPFF